LLTLDGRWEPCAVDTDLRGRSLTIMDANLERRMSGSPILTEDGRAVGVVSVRSEMNGTTKVEQHGGCGLNVVPLRVEHIIPELIADSCRD
jgi:S1-C subfamily serine protease